MMAHGLSLRCRYILGLAVPLMSACDGGSAGNGGGTGGNSGNGGTSATGGSSTAGGMTNVGGTGIDTTATTAKYTVSAQVSGLNGIGLVLQLNGGNNVTVNANGTVAFAPTLSSGAVYAVTVLTQPSGSDFYCWVKNGSGTIVNANITMTVRCSLVPRYNLVVDSVDKSISTYVIDFASGRSTYIGKTLAGNAPTSVALDPANKFAYVTNSGDGTISQFSVGANGSLTALQAPTVAAGTSVRAITVAMSGKFAYAVNNAAPGSVSQYAVDATSGALTSLATAAVTAGNSPISISLDTTGAYAYVVNSGDATVSQFKISADGSLTPLTTPTIETGKSPSALAISPTGKAAYLTNAGDANVSQYAIVDGALSPMTAATVASGTNPVAITIDPLGTHAYVVNNGGNTVSQYTLDPTTGALSSMSTATVITEAGPNSVIVDPTGQYAYVTNTTGDSVSQFTLGSDGALSANAPPRVPAQMSPGGMAMVGGSVPTRAVAEYAYVANGGDTLSLYTIGTSGTLTALDTMTVTGTGPTSIAVDPSGKHAYVTNSNADTVSQYSIDTTGRLVALTPLAVAAKAVPTAIAIRPSGKYAYVMNQVDRSLSQYSIATDGTFSPLARASIKVTTTGGPNSMAIDSSGRFLYVSITNGTLAQFAIGIDGLVSALSPATVSVGTSPTGVCISPSGKYLYMANSSNNELWQFSIGATGTLTPLNPTTIAAGTQPAAIALDATGKYAYAANMKTADISQYAVSDSGALAALATAKVPAGVAGTDSPYWIAIDSSGQFAYVVNDRVSGGGVWQYSLGANGSLTALVDKAQRSGPVGALGCPFFDVTAAHARAVASGDPLVGLTPEIPRNTGNGCPSTHHVRRHAVVSSCRQCP